MKLAVILYANAANPLGFPTQYPAEVKQVPDDYVFTAPWQEITAQELDFLFTQYGPTVQEIAKAKESVPSEVALWQFRAALKLSGLYDQVLAAIATLSTQQRTVIEEQFGWGNTIHRTHPVIMSFAANLSLTEAQVDDVFRLANSLN